MSKIIGFGFGGKEFKIEDSNTDLSSLMSELRSEVSNISNSQNSVVIMNDDTSASVNIGDEKGNIIVLFIDGHIKTKNFDSSNILVTPTSTTSNWYGKTIAFLGDSLTDLTATLGALGDNKYWKKYCSLVGATGLDYGKSGSHLASFGSADTYIACETRYNNISSDVDMIIVFAGVNDYGHDTTEDFGSFSDGALTGVYTLYAGLHRLFKGLKTKFPSKPIVVMTPLHFGSSTVFPNNKECTINDSGAITIGTNATTGKTYKEYVEAIKEVASFYGIIILDAYSESGISPIINSNYYSGTDTVHPIAAGTAALAKWMRPRLEEVYKMFY